MFDSIPACEVVTMALTAPPSPELLGALTRIRPEELDPGLQVDLMVAWERAAAWVTACQLPVLAMVGDVAFAAAQELEEARRDEAFPYRVAHAEVGAACGYLLAGRKDVLMQPR